MHQDIPYELKSHEYLCSEGKPTFHTSLMSPVVLRERFMI